MELDKQKQKEEEDKMKRQINFQKTLVKKKEAVKNTPTQVDVNQVLKKNSNMKLDEDSLAESTNLQSEQREGESENQLRSESDNHSNNFNEEENKELLTEWKAFLTKF